MSDAGQPGGGDPRAKTRWILWMIAAFALIAAFAIGIGFDSNSTAASLPYSSFKAQVLAGNVSEVTFSGDQVSGVLKQPIRQSGGGLTSTFNSQMPQFGDPELMQALQQKHVLVQAQNSNGGWANILWSVLPIVAIFVFTWWLFRRMQPGRGGGGSIFDFGKSKARLVNQGKQRITFQDVAGVDEARAELEEIVAFLRQPSKFQRLGGRMPHGVLLVGPPGTGKTLLARAVAGEARVPFFNISASEFVEMFVGVGASRVRDLFEKAKKQSPAVVFVDELDAVGRQRGAGLGGGNDEREQTLNQLLVEMDGFDPNDAIVVIAATNRVDVLDPALLRPGRFDRRVVVDRPDRRGRLAILKVHTRGAPLGPDVDLDVLARSTPGLVGADLANLVNEASLTAARKGQSKISMLNFEEAFDRIILGSERKIVLDETERRIIAYHESGHALVAWYQPLCDPVHKVTIVPRGQALGVTQSMPVDDRHNLGEAYLHARIAMALGGRAAEQLALNSITTGAQNDLEVATQMARRMVTSWGMSEKMGLLAFDDSQESIFLGREMAGQPRISQETAAIVDREVKRILDEEFTTAQSVLTEHREQLDALAAELLKEEVLDRNQIAALIGPRPEIPQDDMGLTGQAAFSPAS